MSEFEFINVSKHYDNIKVLDNITFSIKKNSITSFIGKNGSGKTTALKLISNMLIPSEGQLTFREEPIKFDDNNLFSNIGLFFDPERSLYWRLSGEENLKRIIELKSSYPEEDWEISCSLLKRLDLYKNRKKLIKDYSKGMKAKLLFISCFIHSPDVLIMDEPFEGLDYTSKLEELKILKEYRELGNTIIITAHNLLDIQNLSSDIIWFNNGRISIIGTPTEVIDSIKGEGVIEIFSYNANYVINNIVKLMPDIISYKVDGDKISILVNEIVDKFNLLKHSDIKDIERIELHLKGLEDIYLFSNEKDKYYENN